MAERVDEALRVAGRLVSFAALTGVIFFGLGVMLKPLFPDGLPRGPEGRQLYLILLAVALGIAQVVMVAVAEKGDWRHTGLERAGWSTWAIASGIGLGVVIPVAVVSLGGLLGGPAWPLSWSSPTTSVFLLALVSTLVDALMLRGYAIGQIARRWGDVAAVALTALVATLFALAAEAPTPLLLADAFVVATCLGVLRLRSGSLMAAWLAHTLWELGIEGLGAVPMPGITAGMLAVVSFLLLFFRPRTASPGRH